MLGFTEIRMLGIDLRYDLPKTHFFGDGKQFKCKLSRPLKFILERYRMAFGELTERGVKIVNESPLEGPLDAFLPKEKSPWLKT